MEFDDLFDRVRTLHRTLQHPINFNDVVSGIEDIDGFMSLLKDSFGIKESLEELLNCNVRIAYSTFNRVRDGFAQKFPEEDEIVIYIEDELGGLFTIFCDYRLKRGNR